MHHEVVGDEVVEHRHGHVVDLLRPERGDACDPVPDHVDARRRCHDVAAADHGGVPARGTVARHGRRDAVVGLELVEPPPSVRGQERVVRRRGDRPAALGLDLVDDLGPVVVELGGRDRDELVGRVVEREQLDALATGAALDDLLQRQRPAVGQLDPGVAGQALPHRGTGSDDDEVLGLQASGQAVEVVEPGGQTGDLGVVLAELLEPLERGDEQLGQRRVLTAGADVGDPQDLALGPADRGQRVLGVLVAHAHDVGAGLDESAQQRLLAHDVGVVLGIGRRRGRRDQVGDGRGAADLVDAVAVADPLEHRDRVDRGAVADQRLDRLEHHAVGRAVEVLGVEDLGDGGRRVLREHRSAEDRDLCLQGVRRDAVERLATAAATTTARAVEAVVGRRRTRVVATLVHGRREPREVDVRSPVIHEQHPRSTSSHIRRPTVRRGCDGGDLGSTGCDPVPCTTCGQPCAWRRMRCGAAVENPVGPVDSLWTAPTSPPIRPTGH